VASLLCSDVFNVLFPSETDMFFLAISMVGTDFSMICQLFSLRTRREIKVSDEDRYRCLCIYII